VTPLLLGVMVASSLAAQGRLHGSAFDSLTRAPLASAEILVRGTALRAITDNAGQFQLDGIPPGRQIVVLSHPGLDSAGFYNLAVTVTVEAGRVATAQLTTPSLRTIWRRGCGGEFERGADSGLVVGAISDVASGNRLHGAAVVATWFDLRQAGPTEVRGGQRTAAARTDSIGNYALCGGGTDATVHLRAYGAGDSTGAIPIQPGARPITRRDFTVGHTVRGATVSGAVRGEDGRPVVGARVTVADRTTSTNESGAYRLLNLPVGTQWFVVRSVGRPPSEQLVDLRDGETLPLDVSLGTAAVSLDTVRVRANRMTLTLQEIQDRRSTGGGFYRGADDMKELPDIVTALQGFPNVRTERATRGWAVVLPARNALESGCVATVYLDGLRSTYDELSMYKPADLRAIEIFPRAPNAPLKYQGRNGCGVVLVWTKYLQ
jgi:hypothetical protein